MHKVFLAALGLAAMTMPARAQNTGNCRHDEAREQFERVLAVANDLGLLAEEYNVPGRHLAGNFPQALTHLALVNTALRLSGPVLQCSDG